LILFPGMQSVFNYLGLICGILTVWYAWRTQFRDPGILDPHLSYSSNIV